MSERKQELSDYEKFEDLRWSRMIQPRAFRHDAAYDLLLKSGSASYLDVGCGDGFFERFVKDRKPEIFCSGVDLSSIAVSKAQKKVPDAVFTVMDASTQKLPFKDSTFDCVIALDVLEHSFIPENLLREMKRVSSKYLIVGVPNFSSLPARIQTMRGKVPENNKPSRGHAYWFTYAKLIEMLENEKLRVKAVKMNYQTGGYTLLQKLFSYIGPLIPGLLALSFVVLVEKDSEIKM